MNMAFMPDTGQKRFYEAAALLGARVAAALREVPAAAADGVQEIRLRAGAPLALYTGREHLFVDMRGGCRGAPPANAFTVTRTDLFECFRALCGYSVHTHQHEIGKGYIALPGGHRAGVCGTLAGEGERGGGLRDVTSINLRVAREVKGAASGLARRLFADGLCGVLLAGPPASGKTTLLRDLARCLSSGELGAYYKVAVVDERCELAAVHLGVPQNDLGPCADLLCGYPKSMGIEIAVRTLSPQVLVCDEVGRADELEAVALGLFSAVSVITTVHCASRRDLARRKQARGLLDTGAFAKVVLLGSSETPGSVSEVLDTEELRAAFDKTQ